ncbi:rCG22843, partial [Rattus norvegicus]
MKRDAEATG